MTEKKARFKLYKSGKLWVVASLFKALPIPVAPVNQPSRHQTLLLASATALGLLSGGLD